VIETPHRGRKGKKIGVYILVDWLTRGIRERVRTRGKLGGLSELKMVSG